MVLCQNITEKLHMDNPEYDAIIRRYVAAYNAFDIEAMLACLHEDVRFENIAGGVSNALTNGKPALAQLAHHSAGLFQTRSQTVRSLRFEGEKAIADIAFEAVLAQDIPDGPKAGATITVQGKTTFTFRDGLIASILDES